MKTEREIQEADLKEQEIKREKAVVDRAAQSEFNNSTREAWEEYERIWKPARERWEKYSLPHFKVLQAKLVASSEAESKALGEVRGNWQKCPKCGLPAARYQTYCIDDKCGTNLILNRP